MSKAGRKRLEPNHPLARWLKNNPLGLNSVTLAARLGVSKSMVDCIAKRRRRPSLTLTAKLMDITGLPMETFLRPLRLAGFGRVDRLYSKLRHRTQDNQATSNTTLTTSPAPESTDMGEGAGIGEPTHTGAKS